MRRTKIVATLGPATDAPGVIEDVIRRGTDVVRLNFSHGSAADHEKRVRAVRAASERAGKHVAVLGDLQGPLRQPHPVPVDAGTVHPGGEFYPGVEDLVGTCHSPLLGRTTACSPRDIVVAVADRLRTLAYGRCAGRRGQRRPIGRPNLGRHTVNTV